MSLAFEARQFLRATRCGALSTLSAKFAGYPFGSVAPFILDHSGQPVVLISTIAEHTKNITANPHVSLLVFANDEDLQASARLTLIGEAKLMDEVDVGLRSRYLRYYPQAAGYFESHDFNLYQIQILQARYIAGFGKMGWMTADTLLNEILAGSELLIPSTKLAAQETAIIDHMNADHARSLSAYAKHFYNIEGINPQMLGIDSEGFDINVLIAQTNQNKTLRFSFEQPVHDAQSARIALVAMSKVAKV